MPNALSTKDDGTAEARQIAWQVGISALPRKRTLCRTSVM